MIPLMSRYAYLRDIVLATSAMHLATYRRCNGQSLGAELVHALSARQRAITQLRAAMAHVTSGNRYVILAAVVFFVNFDLMDSGKGTWKAHLDAAGVLINTLCGRSNEASPLTQRPLPDKNMARLIDVVVADCLTYHILGSTLTVDDEPTASVYDDIDVLAVLHRAEAYSYHCCPPAILQIYIFATQLGRSSSPGSFPPVREEQHRTELATSLLMQALAVDVRAWVDNIHGLSTDDDREARVRLAFAHRAAACLYITLGLSSAVARTRDRGLDADELVAEILQHLSYVPSDHVLVKGSVWPSFMAAAQTDDPGQRRWCKLRLQAMWRSSPYACPWGYVETAMRTVEGVWAIRDLLPLAEKKSWNWLKQLKESREINCLIV